MAEKTDERVTDEKVVEIEMEISKYVPQILKKS